ncbi:RNA polymerase sigma factor [Propionibacteriaceae bacterium Y2011]
MGPADDPLGQVFREERGRLLALLVSRFGDFDLAEEVSAEAFLAAAESWPRTGVPDHPLAWLATTARRKALDRIRRDAVLAGKLALLHADADPRRAPDPFGPATDPATAGEADHEHLPDDRLQLFFACCHPALDTATQTALTLRYVAGLSTEEIATAFLVPTATMAQRLTRGKRKIERSRIPFRVPGPDELAERLGLVLHVCYLVFSEGYAATDHTDLVRDDLADEAVRLVRILHRRLPGDPSVTGLLALMLLTDARRAARVDASGVAVSLADQDRRRWDADLIAEGVRLTEAALRDHPPTSWSIQAAIAAVHDEAATAEATDWLQIRLLYDILYGLTPVPVVALNRAIAVGWADGPERGLALLDELADDPGLARQPHWYAARGHVLARLERYAEAAVAYGRAADLARTPAEVAHLRARATALS